MEPRQAERDGEQPGRLRREVGTGRVGAADDGREPEERLGGEAELLDHGVEGAGLAAVAPEHALDVEGRGAEALGDRRHLRRRDEEEHRGGIDEAADQPGTGDAVDLRPRAGHPDRAALGVARRQAVGRDQRQAGLGPGEEPAFEHVGLAAGVTEPGGDALAELQALLADDDRRPAGKRRSPRRHGGEGPSHRAGNEPRVGGEVLVGADVDDRRAFRRADEAGEFLQGHGGW